MSYHLQSMSIGYLIDEDTPMIWRGPMVTQALEQLLKDTNWKDLDYLIIDLPPGTGDTQLTLAQKVPVSGVVIVTTPQDIALLDARKGLKMFEKVEVAVLGIVENMSIHICSECGHEEHIFGQGGGQRMSEEFDVDFLGALPLDIRIREETDNGKPTVVAEPDSRISQIYREIARRTAAKLSLQSQELQCEVPADRDPEHLICLKTGSDDRRPVVSSTPYGIGCAADNRPLYFCALVLLPRDLMQRRQVRKGRKVMICV